MSLCKLGTDPATFTAYSHAAAGHEGVRSDPTGTILIKPCTRAEVAFYESAATHPAFQTYMPTFMGTLTLNENQDISAATIVPAPLIRDVTAGGSAVPWVPSGGKKLDTGISIVLENVTAGFKRPNVIDLKLGARLWADDAPEAKRRKLDETSNATTSRSLGFRICGMRVYRPDRKPKEELRFAEHIEVDKDGYFSFGKSYGRKFNADNVHEAFVEYFGGSEALKKPNGPGIVVRKLARELKNLACVLKNEESRMLSASILMVYEGDEEAMKVALEKEKQRPASKDAEIPSEDERLEENEDSDDEEEPKVYDMRLIDFAHASWTPGQGPDENALEGIRSVLKILDQIDTEK